MIAFIFGLLIGVIIGAVIVIKRVDDLEKKIGANKNV